MPTPAERKALLFLATVVALGAGVRGVRAARGASPADPAAQRALASQIQAVDSARAATPRRGRARTTLPEPRTGLTPGLSARASRESRGSRATTRKDHPDAPAPDARPIDLDRASAAEMEALPRIGPALARRIVANRDSLGAFGSLAELQRVRGVGPAMAKLLEGRVTFSGTARPSNAVAGPRVTSPSTSRKSRRRTPRP